MIFIFSNIKKIQMLCAIFNYCFSMTESCYIVKNNIIITILPKTRHIYLMVYIIGYKHEIEIEIKN